MGLVLEAPAAPQDEYVLWPELVPVWNAWHQVQTQWRDGFNGRTGLDYTGVRSALKCLGARKKQIREWFPLLQEAERAAMDEWAKRQKR